MNHAIPTLYQGIEYRSRLEARWAAMFDNIGWKFTYEPFDTNGYIPDFLIHGDRPMLVEIKPAVSEVRLPRAGRQGDARTQRALGPRHPDPGRRFAAEHRQLLV